jgi:site-specific DNA recombinase
MQFREMAQLTTAGQAQQQAAEHKLAASLRRVAREEQRLVDAYQAEVITLEELAARRRQLTDRHQALSRQQAEQIKLRQETVTAQKTFADLSAFCARVRTRLDEATFAEKQSILQMLIERVIVGAETLEIRHVIPLRGSIADEGASSAPEGRLRSDGVHHAELHLGARIDSFDGFRKAL